MSAAAIIENLLDDAVVQYTCAALGDPAHIRDMVLASGRMQMLAECGALDAETLAAYIVTSELEYAGIAMADDLPQRVQDAALDAARALPAGATGRDRQMQWMSPNTTAGMLRLSEFFHYMRANKQDDENFFLHAVLCKVTLHEMALAADLERYPAGFLRLCAAELRAMAHQVEDFDADVVGNPADMAAKMVESAALLDEMTDRLLAAREKARVEAQTALDAVAQIRRNTGIASRKYRI